MAFQVAFIHTVPALIGLFNDLSNEYLPEETEVFHIADEVLLRVVLASGGLTPFIYRRVAEHAAAAAEAGADLIQLTCSSISPTAETARRMVAVPVLKIDEPMIDCALEIGRRIGIAATAPTTLKPTQEQLYQRAQQKNIMATVDAYLCEGAYAALFKGDVAAHDQIVREGLIQLMEKNDVVLLAQASMARVADQLKPEEMKAPVLSSPRLAMEKLKGLLLERST
jgi:Asp/Glu/hydantoin racemase